MNLVSIYKKHPTQWLGDYLKMQLQVAKFVDKKSGNSNYSDSIIDIYSMIRHTGVICPDIDIDLSGRGDTE